MKGLLIEFFLSGRQCVLHQHTDGHWAYAAGYGGDVGTFGSHLVELHVAVQAEAAFLCRVWYAGGAHVYHGRPFLHHVGRHEVWLPDGGDDDVRLLAFLLQVAAVAVAHGHRRVAVLLLHHELCHGFAYDVAAAQDDALAPAGLDVVAAEQFKDAFRRGGDVAGQSDGHASHVDGVEAVHVLAVVDGLDDLLFRDVLRQGG